MVVVTGNKEKLREIRKGLISGDFVYEPLDDLLYVSHGRCYRCTVHPDKKLTMPWLAVRKSSGSNNAGYPLMVEIYYFHRSCLSDLELPDEERDLCRNITI